MTKHAQDLHSEAKNRAQRDEALFVGGEIGEHPVHEDARDINEQKDDEDPENVADHAVEGGAGTGLCQHVPVGVGFGEFLLVLNALVESGEAFLVVGEVLE